MSPENLKGGFRSGRQACEGCFYSCSAVSTFFSHNYSKTQKTAVILFTISALLRQLEASVLALRGLEQGRSKI